MQKAIVHITFQENGTIDVELENGAQIGGRAVNRMTHILKRKIGSARSAVVQATRKKEREAAAKLTDTPVVVEPPLVETAEDAVEGLPNPLEGGADGTDDGLGFLDDLDDTGDGAETDPA